VRGTNALITSATGAVTVTGVGGNGSGATNYGTVLASGGQITSTGSGNAITVFNTGNFINNSGSSALSTPNGRWLVYSTNPASDTVGGLSNSFRRFSCTYGGSCPSFPATGNGLLYSFTPTLTITPTALASALTYGDAAPNLVGYAYGASGYLGSDATADTLSGSLTGTTSYTQGSNVGTYNINYSSGSLTSAMGYGFTYANNASAITVNPRVLTAALQGTVSKTYDRTTTASLAAGNYSLSNIYGTDDVALNNSSAGTYDTANVGTGKTVSVTGLTLSGAKAANYTLAASAVNGTVGTITAKALTITANNKAMTYGDGNNFNGYSSSGLVAGDAISAVDLATNASLSGAGQWNAGSWLISAANASGSGLSNYSIAYNSGTLTVGKRSLGGVVNNQTLTYGAATPSYGKNDVTWTGFYGSDSVASLTSATIDNGGYAQGSNAGTYTLTLGSADLGTLATNYQLGTVAPGILTVTGLYVPDTVRWVSQNASALPSGVASSKGSLTTNPANDNQPSMPSHSDHDELTIVPSNDNLKGIGSPGNLLMLTIDPLLAQNLGLKHEFLKGFATPARKTQLNHNNLSETILAWAS
jgi:hypothetical protein